MAGEQQFRKPRILVCAGSARADSLHRHLAQAAQVALETAGADASFVEIGDYDLPLYNQGIEEKQGLPTPARTLRDMLLSHDGMVLASPEYNGSYSPLSKNTIDWVSRPLAGERHSSAFKGKAAALMSTTPGPGGGRAGLSQLRQLLEWLGMRVATVELSIPGSSHAFDDEGKLSRQEDIQQLTTWAEAFVMAFSI